MRFENGCTGTISYLTGGNPRYQKETLDAAAGGRSARLDNFRQAAVWAGRKRTVAKSRGGQDKGQHAELAQFRRGLPVRRGDADHARFPAGHHQGDDRGGGEPEQRPSGAGVGMPPASRLSWYARRAARMSPAEVAWRARDQAVQLAWSRRQVRREQAAAGPPEAGSPRAGERRFTAVLPPGTAARVPAAARAAVLAAADQLMLGEWEVLGVVRTDLVRPDWFHDPVTGHRAPADRYAFRINHRSQEQTGNIKQVWEISRLHHLTLLATAWFLTHDEPYARRVADQLRSWWRENPFLSGVHWTSGIEIGIRLISLAWIRRLLDDWPGVTDLFEDDELAGAADPLASAVPRRLPQPGLVGQQPRHRRGGRAARGQLRLPVVPGERPLAAAVRPAARARAGPQHVPVRHRPRARHRTTSASSRNSGCWPPSRRRRPTAR